MNRKVLITGATGDTGRAAIKESIKRGLDVRALVHGKDDRSAALEKLGAEVVLGDLLKIDAIRQAMEGIDATVNFAQAAKEAGVSAIVNLSQRSADRNSKSHSCKDHFIAEQVLNWSGLAVTHLRPTYFLEWLLYPWQLPLFVEKGIIRLPVGKGRHAPIGAKDQGRVIAAILQNPSEHAGQTYPLFGPVEMDHDQMAAELTEALGRKIVFENVSIDEYCKSMETMGVPPYIIQHLGGAMDAYQHGVMGGMNDNSYDGICLRRRETQTKRLRNSLERLVLTLTTGENHESNGNWHAETSFAGTTTAVSAKGSPRDVATLSRRQDGAVLAAGQRGGRYLPDERGFGRRGGPASESTTARSSQSADLRPDADRTPAAARHVDESEIAPLSSV
jgi:NAD(P)H dehydrogenase (quinone)